MEFIKRLKIVALWIFVLFIFTPIVGVLALLVYLLSGKDAFEWIINITYKLDLI